MYYLKKIIPDKIYRILNRNKFLVPNVKKINNIMSEMSYNKKLLYKPIEKFNLNQIERLNLLNLLSLNINLIVKFNI